MLRNRWLILVGGCLLTASAALGDDIGVVDCAKSADQTPVFAKPRKSNDIVATVACGERFRIVQYGFIFSEIQTADGKIGFIYSNIMTVERAGATLQMRQPANNTPTATAAAEKTKIYAPRDMESKPAQQGPTSVTAAAAASSAPAKSAAATTAPALTVQAEVKVEAAPATPTPAPAPAAAAGSAAPATLPGAASVITATTSNATSPDAPADSSAAANPAPSTAAGAQAATAEVPVAPATPAASAPATTAPAAAVADPAPAPATNAAPPRTAAPATEAPAAEVEPAPITDPNLRRSWDKPNPTSRSASLLELFGGASFARMNSGGSGANYMGFMGSFGFNVRPWIQVVGDSSYSTDTVSGTKNVVYGNHYGPRLFMRGLTGWKIAPFGEALFGGSRADTTVSGTTTSQNCFSMKVGGGVDIRPSRWFEIRLIDVDYYRTSFGTNVQQSNYWVSSGLVITLFKGLKD
jgi:hypothetical protein